jgi:RNA polymerase sigma-70 factor (sigma-E family)
MHSIGEAGAITMSARAHDAKDADFTAYLAARQPALLRTAYLLTGNRANAEDLLQNSLAKLYLSWDKVRQRESLDGYVRRIMVNENNSQWRRPWKRHEVAVEQVPERRATADTYDDGQSALMWSFVQTLPRRQRAVVVLRYYEDLTEAETAQALGCSVGTVKSQASRALASLRERAPTGLRPDGPTPSTGTHPREEER